MKLDTISFFNLASDRMQWLAARQKVLAENIANADTPNYRARDVTDFESFLEKSNSGTRAAGGAQQEVTVETVRAGGAWDSSLDGNDVTLEQQSVMASENAEQYRLATNLYRKAYQLLNAASGKE
ncbi:flagellar basal body rod protein FlgB [Thioclava atlantica]|uniref:Flagellar basal body rod protein FlgB n=1 Tax=Thioclava atlantica TaxID=1317124 RepID=A0A085TY73_9RHOB|nr:flagellar basal body protein [Thioclava atlantica]KFE35670.1 flagellar basal-body rod protein FlgB [Thioclava atlantica]